MSAPTVPTTLQLTRAVEEMSNRLCASAYLRGYYELWDGDDSPKYQRADRAVKRQAAALRRLLDALRSAP